VGAGLIVNTELSAQLMATTFGGGAIPLPFARDILLLETWIAGITFEDRRKVAAELPEGLRLTLVRRPDNPHDAFAIEVRTAEAVLLGFVPRAHNQIPARLMDAGKLLFATLRCPPGEAKGCRIELVLQDV
jgi:hypothetical protein